MVINKTIVRVISASNRSCPYEFNASIDFWLKTTSHVDVIAPSTVSTTQNAKLLPSPNLGHSLMLCQVTRSQSMGECETLWQPTSISRAMWAAQKSTQLLPGTLLLTIISVICKSDIKEAHAWLSTPFKETYDDSSNWLIAHFSSSISRESDPAHGWKVTSIMAYANNINNWCGVLRGLKNAFSTFISQISLKVYWKYNDFDEEIVFENVVCKMGAILSRP